MLERALNLRSSIDLYYEAYPDDEYKGDILTDGEWVTLTIVKIFLEKLKMATKAIESSNSCLDVVLPVMDFVLSEFKAARIKFADDPILGPMFNSGWTKMTKYYQLTDRSPAYAIALVLNPRYKWTYTEKRWQHAWHAT